MFRLLSPADSAKLVSTRPFLTWAPGDSGARYWLQISRDTLLTDLLLSDTLLTDTVLHVPLRLGNDSTYFWRVAAGDSLSWGPFTPLRSFTTTPVPAVSDSLLPFPVTPINRTTAFSLVLYNPMDTTLRVDTVRLRHRAYQVLHQFPDSVLRGDSLVLQVTFRPDTFAVFPDTLRIITAEGTPAIVLRGESPPPVLSTTLDTLRFGPAAVTDTLAGVFWVRNLGYVNTLTAYVHAPAPHSSPFIILPAVPLRIPPRDSVGILVRFNVAHVSPWAFGTHVGTVQIRTDGGNSQITLHGSSPPPVLVRNAAVMDLGHVSFYSSTVDTIRITNRSVNSVLIDSVFARTRNFLPLAYRGIVRKGDTLRFPFRFTPDRYGAFTDSVTFRTAPPLRQLSQTVYLRAYVPRPTIATSPSVIDFGTCWIGTPTRAELKIANASATPLRIDSVVVRTSAFMVSGAGPGSMVSRDDTLRVMFTFVPDSARQFVDTLYIHSDAAGSPSAVLLRATAVSSEPSPPRRNLPGKFVLEQNYPNPFNSSTTLRYGLPAKTTVTLRVYDALGHLISELVNGEQEAGFYEVRFDGSTLATGVYFARLQSEEAVETRKLLVVR